MSVGGSEPVTLEAGAARLFVPRNALAEDTAFVLGEHALSAFLPSTTALVPLAEVVADFNGQTLGISAELSIGSPGVGADGTLVFAKVERISGIPHLAVVALGQLVGERIVRKDRVVPLGEPAREAVLAYLCERPAHPGALFLSRHERPLSTVMLWRLVKRAGLRAGVAGALPHRLRHSYATHLLRNGAALPELMTLLGHSSFQSTQIYTGVEVADLQRMIERSHPRERA